MITMLENSTAAGIVHATIDVTPRVGLGQCGLADHQRELGLSHFDSSYIDKGLPAATTFPQWGYELKGGNPNLVEEKSFEWHAGPYVAASVYAFLFGIVAFMALRVRLKPWIAPTGSTERARLRLLSMAPQTDAGKLVHRSLSRDDLLSARGVHRNVSVGGRPVGVGRHYREGVALSRYRRTRAYPRVEAGERGVCGEGASGRGVVDVRLARPRETVSEPHCPDRCPPSTSQLARLGSLKDRDHPRYLLSLDILEFKLEKPSLVTDRQRVIDDFEIGRGVLDMDVPAELLVVVEDWVERGVPRKNPAAPAPTTTITITTNRSDEMFVSCYRADRLVEVKLLCRRVLRCDRASHSFK